MRRRARSRFDPPQPIPRLRSPNLPARYAWLMTVMPGSRMVVWARAGDEHQAELADLHLVAVAESSGLDAFPVHIRSVEASDIPNGENASFPVKLGVPARHGDVVQENVTVGVPSTGCHVVIKQESGARVGASAHREQGGTRRQRSGHP